MNHFFRTVPLLVLLALASPTFGWGQLGHQLVGDVAEQYLTDKTREALRELLSDDRTLSDVANWADTIKGQRPETRPWHYANVEEGADAFVMERDCGDKSCVVEQVNLDLEVLRDPESTHAAKVEALFFLVHFVGDIHQPLHLGLAADRGGNDIQVTFDGKKTNLHSLWDTGLLVHTGLDREEYLNGLLRLSGGGKKADWQRSLDTSVWATESWQLANTHAYLVPKSGRLGSAYYGRNIKVVNDRLAAAGVRLATLLNELYDPTEAVFIPPTEDVDRIVYVFGVPNTNEHIVRFRNTKLFQAINALKEDQHFTAIFYKDGQLLEPPPRGVSGKPATERVKKRVQKWISPGAGHLKPHSSKADPMAVLRQAFRYKPDLIYLWLGDSRSMAPTDDELAVLLNEIDRLNKSEAAINTLEWSLHIPSGINRQPTVAESIAEHTGGQHRFYVNDDVMGK